VQHKVKSGDNTRQDTEEPLPVFLIEKNVLPRIRTIQDLSPVFDPDPSVFKQASDYTDFLSSHLTLRRWFWCIRNNSDTVEAVARMSKEVLHDHQNIRSAH
jgi:hypothetical protein